MAIDQKDIETIESGMKVAAYAITVLTPILEDALRKNAVPVDRQKDLQEFIGLVRSGEVFKPSHWQKPTEANS
jgi:hypothetical protein